MTSDPYKTVKSTKDLAWYTPNIENKITPDIRNLLETCSKVLPGDVLKHVSDIRDKAWEIRPYPCTGLGGFLSPMIAKSPIYTTLITLLISGATLLDVGCFRGQDLRCLVFDGAPSFNLYGLDIVNYWDLGYPLFNDKNRFSAKFFESDLLSPSEDLQVLYGKIDIISVTHVLHQWEWEGQITAAKQLVLFPYTGTMVVGHQVGANAGASKQQTSKNLDFSWMRQDRRRGRSCGK